MFTKIEIEKIVKLYTVENYSSYKIANVYNVSRTTITNVLRKENCLRVRTNKYKINHNFFNIIDTEEKSYFLGLLYSDGCIYPKNGMVTISLQEKDKELLEQLSLIIENENSLKYHIETKSKNNAWVLNLFSRQMCEDLIKLGCVPAKSKILNFPTKGIVPESLIHHFIRGVFDGDGSITIDKRSNNKCVSFCGTISMMEGIQKILECEIGLNRNKINQRKDGLCILTYSGNFKVNTFYKYLYKDSTIYMKRKYDIIKDNTGKYENSSNKRGVILTKENKTFHFESLTQAAKFLNCDVSSIYGCLQSKKKIIKTYSCAYEK